MDENVSKFSALITKFLNNDLDEEEKKELDAWKERDEDHRKLFEKLTNEDQLFKAVSETYTAEANIYGKLKKNIAELNEADAVKVVRMQRFSWRRMTAAAAILILVSTAIIYILRKDQEPGKRLANTSEVKPDIAPGANKATLQLADGRTIVLDSTAIGQLAQQGGTQIVNKDGQLVYAAGNGNEKSEVLYNTVSTAKGQTYPLLLSDNSRIWLNSESSIRFPVLFTGGERKVEVTGEVFFEIAHDAAKPFITTVKGVAIQVLGTKFNVNAYGDEDAIKTTLVEGSVRVSKGAQRKQIKPGQQAQVIANEIKIADNVDVDKITAWRQGYFRFTEDKLSEAMKNIARWYNVDVVFEGNAANIDVSGTIPRSANLSELLKLLAIIDIEARIEGRKLILKAQ